MPHTPKDRREDYARLRKLLVFIWRKGDCLSSEEATRRIRSLDLGEDLTPERCAMVLRAFPTYWREECSEDGTPCWRFVEALDLFAPPPASSPAKVIVEAHSSGATTTRPALDPATNAAVHRAATSICYDRHVRAADRRRQARAARAATRRGA